MLSHPSHFSVIVMIEKGTKLQRNEGKLKLRNYEYNSRQEKKDVIIRMPPR